MQGYVDVLEYLARSDAQNAFGGFDQVVALASGVKSSEIVGEGEAGGELFGFDKEAGAVGDPWVCSFHEGQSRLSSRFSFSGSGDRVFVGGARVNVRGKEDGVNSVFLVQLRKMAAADFPEMKR